MSDDGEQQWEPYQPQRQRLSWASRAAVAGIAAVVGLLSGAAGDTITDSIKTVFGPDTTVTVAGAVEGDDPVADYGYTLKPPTTEQWWVPAEAMTPGELRFLAAMTPEQQTERIIELGGIQYGGNSIELSVEGMRTTPIRIENISYKSKCEPLQAGAGAFVYLSGGRGAAGGGGGSIDDITQLMVNVEEPNNSFDEGHPTINGKTTVDDEQLPFFDRQEVTVGNRESKTFRLHVGTTSEICRTNFDISVEEDTGEFGVEPVEHVIQFPSEGDAVVIGPAKKENTAQRIERAFLGGRLCAALVEVDPAVLDDQDGISSADCGPDNQPIPTGAAVGAKPTPTATPSPTETSSSEPTVNAVPDEPTPSEGTTRSRTPSPSPSRIQPSR